MKKLSELNCFDCEKLLTKKELKNIFVMCDVGSKQWHNLKAKSAHWLQILDIPFVKRKYGKLCCGFKPKKYKNPFITFYYYFNLKHLEKMCSK